MKTSKFTFEINWPLRMFFSPDPTSNFESSHTYFKGWLPKVFGSAVNASGQSFVKMFSSLKYFCLGDSKKAKFSLKSKQCSNSNFHVLEQILNFNLVRIMCIEFLRSDILHLFKIVQDNIPFAKSLTYLNANKSLPTLKQSHLY